MTKRERGFLSDDPPRPWLLWTARIVIVGLLIFVLVAELPDAISRIRTILTTMSPGAERSAALDGVLQEAVLTLIFPIVLLVGIGFGVGIVPAVVVWNRGGPWFVPMWGSRTKRQHAADDRASTTDPRAR